MVRYLISRSLGNPIKTLKKFLFNSKFYFALVTASVIFNMGNDKINFEDGEK